MGETFQGYRFLFPSADPLYSSQLLPNPLMPDSATWASRCHNSIPPSIRDGRGTGKCCVPAGARGAALGIVSARRVLLFEHQGAVGSRRDGSPCPAQAPTSPPVPGAGAQLPLFVTFDSTLTFFCTSAAENLSFSLSPPLAGGFLMGPLCMRGKERGRKSLFSPSLAL